MRHSSRNCGLRREHEQPRGGIAAGQRNDAWPRIPGPRPGRSAPYEPESLQRSAVRSTPEFCKRFAGSPSCQSANRRESVCRPPPPAGYGLRSASAVAARKSPPRRLASRHAPGTQVCQDLCAFRSHAASNAVKPNSSFKPSPNSVARRASSAGPAAHFALAVQRATLSVPA